MASKNLSLLASQGWLSLPQWREVLEEQDHKQAQELAYQTLRTHVGTGIFYRGIVECTNHCIQGCRYCGISANNTELSRYRLDLDTILAVCQEGYQAGIRTFVLQGGEDPAITDAWLTNLIKELRTRFPNNAITLSFGERSRASYQALFDAGASRYLLRHETASPLLYEHLHRPRQRFWHRISCLYALKDIGFQTGCGMMIGVPGQTLDDIAQDMAFIQDFKPHMLGIGPFIPNTHTDLKDAPAGDFTLTLFVMSLCRILFPRILMPATTALRTLLPNGLSQGVLHGCNVVMPSLTPKKEKAKYLLYDKKIQPQESISQTMADFASELASIGHTLTVARGDAPENAPDDTTRQP
ncbi:MAG: [Desulfovibrio sp.]|nr:[FeFe] hydrogenase H-cluster radical SAM maturase HydE [Desulfovibrio sp.]